MADDPDEADILIAKHRAARQQQWAIQRTIVLVGFLAGILAFAVSYGAMEGFNQTIRLVCSAIVMFVIMFPAGLVGRLQGEKAFKQARARYGLTSETTEAPKIDPNIMKGSGVGLIIFAVPIGGLVMFVMESLYSGPLYELVVFGSAIATSLLVLLVGLSVYRLGRDSNLCFPETNEGERNSQ